MFQSNHKSRCQLPSFQLKKYNIFFFFLAFVFGNVPFLLQAQLTPECQLDIGTNLAGLADFGTELPFVDLMKNARQWYTKDIDNPNAAFDSGHASHLSYRSDGYPTHVPQVIPESNFSQKVVTIWGITDGWMPGQYTVLWEGTGTLGFIGGHQNLEQTNANRIVFDFPNPVNSVLEMTILSSDINDPIHNIRVLMPGTELTYMSQPFNPVFIDILSTFQTVRFMDWGQTNNWGQEEDNWNDPSLFDWSERSQMDHYTWAYGKGVPYEMMVKLLNDYDLDGWVCVPHRASDDYLTQMANFFRDNLETERHLTVEYSNEIWNWIFGQTHWLNEYGCIQTGLEWPLGLAPYVQNCLDHFTTSFDGQLDRITRAVGAFTGWPYITDVIVSNLTPGSFDAIAPTFYFGIPESGDAVLDSLGENATVADIAYFARQGMVENLMYINMHQTDIADPLGLPLKFYEGGQHLTPTPFGVEPTYAQALLDIQRDTAMFNLYNEWFDDMRTLQSGNEPLQLMHFSFVSIRSAQYGSWGMLETMDQNIDVIPAPKYSSILENLAPADCNLSLSVEMKDYYLEQKDCSTSIIWRTINEEQNKHFVIERSDDGRTFESIGKIDGVGASNDSPTYQFKDNLSLSGRYYYRIQQVDLDGSIHELGTRTIELDCDHPLLLFPNPTQDFLTVYAQENIAVEKMRITNIAGKTVLEQAIDGLRKLEELNVDVQFLPSGIYHLNLIGSQGNVIGKRFLKFE